MQLTQIHLISGTIELITGLHIGSGNSEMHIGGTDNPVMRNPIDNRPYIPGSSLKGKMRSLLEWHSGVVGSTEGHPLGFSHVQRLPAEQQPRAQLLLKLFGGAPEGNTKHDKLVVEVGPTRLAFWDCQMNSVWVNSMRERNLLLTEVKMENSINRIKGVAEHPRNTERVPAGARFDFRLTLKVHDGEDLLEEVLRGLRLLELTGIGGSGSRGYGKIAFCDLCLEQESLMERLATVAL